MPATIPVIVAGMAASHRIAGMAASHRIAGTAASYRIAGTAASHRYVDHDLVEKRCQAFTE